jgi:carbon monoxide dehydrogenase subunit G
MFVNQEIFMSFIVSTTVERSFQASCNAKKAFEFLSKASEAMQVFPKLQQFTETKEGVWLWETQKLALGNLSHAIKGYVQYKHNGENHIAWQPAPGESNAQLSGHWSIKAAGDNACNIALVSKGDYDIPLPSLIKRMVETTLNTELNKLMDEFVQNMQKKLV